MKFRWLKTRTGAYRRLFLTGDGRVGPDASFVLADLKNFCCVEKPTVRISPITRMVDTHATMIAEGRREVFNRIQAHLRLDDQQIAALIEEPDE